MDSAGEHGALGFHDQRAHPRTAARHGSRTRELGGAHRLARQRVAAAAGTRQHHDTAVVGPFLRRDLVDDAPAQPARDAVGRDVLRRIAVDHGAAGVHARQGRSVQGDPGTVPRDGDDVFDADIPVAQGDPGHGKLPHCSRAPCHRPARRRQCIGQSTGR